MSESPEQRELGWMVYPDHGWRRVFFRGPLVLWRLGLARAHPPNFLVLTTTGRKSGQPRYTMLEHTRLADRIYITSGWGTRTQWYKNIQADPRVSARTTGGEVVRGRAVAVRDDGALRRLFVEMRGKSPVWDDYLASWDIKDDLEDFLAKKDRTCVLRIDPTDEPTPAPFKTDLLWVWAALGLVVAALLLL